jgi:hypothetical protein
LKDLLHSQGPSSRSLTSFCHSPPERWPFCLHGSTNTTNCSDSSCFSSAV